MTKFSDRERGEGGQLQLAVVDKAKATKKDKDTQQKERNEKKRKRGREGKKSLLSSSCCLPPLEAICRERCSNVVVGVGGVRSRRSFLASFMFLQCDSHLYPHMPLQSAVAVAVAAIFPASK